MNSTHRTRRARILLPLLLAFLLPAAMSVTVAAADSSDVMPISVETESTAKPNNTTSVSTTQTVERKTAPAVSYGLRVMAARDEIVFSGLVGNEITFTAEDICRVMNLSSLDYVTVVELPDAKDGTLYRNFQFHIYHLPQASISRGKPSLCLLYHRKMNLSIVKIVEMGLVVIFGTLHDTDMLTVRFSLTLGHQ